jgi:hypothetical protein
MADELFTMGHAAEYVGVNALKFARLVKSAPISFNRDPWDKRIKLFHRADLDQVIKMRRYQPVEATQWPGTTPIVTVRAASSSRFPTSYASARPVVAATFSWATIHHSTLTEPSQCQLAMTAYTPIKSGATSAG